MVLAAVVNDAEPTHEATNAAMEQQDTTGHNDTTLSLPSQSDSSSDDDDSVEKTSGVVNDENKEEESSTKTTRRTASSRLSSFDIETSSPTKKRRVHSNLKWDSFVRRGARLKGLLEDAMQLASTNSARESDNVTTTLVTPMRQATVTTAEHNHAADIAREKTAENIILQRVSTFCVLSNDVVTVHSTFILSLFYSIYAQKLKEAEVTAAAMAAANASLREAALAHSERMERTVEALRIAGTNAANARADADAAEACAASMATQLQALKDVVDETKRASQVLYKEHEQVSAGARSMEAKLLQRETELARAQKEQRQWMEEKEKMKSFTSKLQEEKKTLEQEVNRLTEELHEMKHQADEYAAVEQARKDRAAMVEKELREARTMLMEATSAAAETESTAAVLNDTIKGLEEENKTLHETLETIQAKAREENERLNDSLTKAEKEAQSLRIKAASHEEDIHRMRMDKSASEKEVSKLKTKVSGLERRLKDATSYASTLALDDASDSQPGEASNTASTSRAGRNGVAFAIPPLNAANTPASSKAKENRTNRVTPGTAKATKCCICKQNASGFVKSCQCGKPSCQLRAHATCITASNLAPPSVSHPGTPALRPPVLLCGRTDSL